MDQKRAIELLKISDAQLDGHFLLTSGNHSDRYIQCALLLSRPDLAVEFIEDLAGYFKRDDLDVIAAPALGGIIVSYEVARLLGKRAIFLERENGVMTLRRGLDIKKDERVLIVEDVITTGGSVLEVSKAIEERGGIVKAYASLVNRSRGRFNPSLPYYYCINMDIPVYIPENCPLCREGVPLLKPGSRFLK